MHGANNTRGYQKALELKPKRYETVSSPDGKYRHPKTGAPLDEPYKPNQYEEWKKNRVKKAAPSKNDLSNQLKKPPLTRREVLTRLFKDHHTTQR